MRKYLSKDLFKESIIEILYISIIVLVLGVAITAVTYMLRRGEMLIFYSSTEDFITVDIALLAVTILGSNLIARKLVSFAWIKSKTDVVYSSLHSRQQIFCTKALAAISVQCALLIAIGLTGALMTFRYLGKIVFLSDIIMTTLNMMLLSLIIIGAVFMSVGVTGRRESSALIVDWIVLSPALMFVVRYFSGTYRQIKYNSYFMQRTDLYILPNMIAKAMGKYDASRYLPSIIIAVVLIIVIFAAGYILLKKRGGELTGSYTKNKFVHFLMIGFLPFSIVFTTLLFLFTSEEISLDAVRLAFFFLAAAAISVIVQERVINKKMEKNNRCIWVYLACVALSLAIVYPAVLIADREGTVELTADEIQSVNVIKYGEYWGSHRTIYGPTYGDYLSTDYSIESTRMKNKIVDLYAIKDENLTGMQMQLVKINLKNGKEIKTRVPVFVEWGDNRNSIETDLDDVLYSQQEYMDLLYTPIPQEYITFIYDSNMYEIDKRQDKLKSIHYMLSEEFTVLSYDIKRELMLINMVSTNMAYVDISAKYSDENIIPIGYIYVRGRVGSNTVIDEYKLTAYTPDASNAYIRMMFEQNKDSYTEFLERYKENPEQRHYPYYVSLYYMDDDGQLKIDGGDFFVVNKLSKEYRQQVAEVIQGYDLQMPEIGDKFAVVEYNNPDADGSTAMFIKISGDQADELMEIFQAYSTKK